LEAGNSKHIDVDSVTPKTKLLAFDQPIYTCFIPFFPLYKRNIIYQLILRHAFEKAVVRRMMSDVPWGVLLSGGLDSSLVASICARHMARRSTSFPQLHSFTIGLVGSPDLQAAKKVADFLGTIHHAYTYTLEQGADAIRDVIQMIETYDVTTVRASTPMYLMSRKIKAMGIKMVLSGEGADEVFGGYLYFHKAPNARELHEECVDKLSRLHLHDCLRCNKAMSAWGVEPPPKDRRIEKWVMRQAFDEPEDPYLPNEILWRQKEQFSDGACVCFSTFLSGINV
jgi:asparagine synthase (glutamine-hydrolysing)